MAPSPTQCEAGTSPKETSQENQLRPRSWKDLLVASGCRPFMLEHDKLPADFYLQEEKGAMKATEGLEQRDSTTWQEDCGESGAFSVHLACFHLRYLTLCALSHCHQFRIKAQLQKLTVTTLNFSDRFCVYRLS